MSEETGESRRDFLILGGSLLGGLMIAGGVYLMGTYADKQEKAAERERRTLEEQQKASRRKEQERAARLARKVASRHAPPQEGLVSCLEQRFNLVFDSSTEYAPMVNAQRQHIFTSHGDLFEITHNGKPFSGLYVPVNYYNDFDGWRVSRDRVTARPFRGIDAAGEKKQLDVILLAELQESDEFRGMYPLVVPTDAVPSKSIVKALRKKGINVVVDSLGRFFTSQPVKRFSVDYHPNSIKRMDTLTDKEYKGFPDYLRLNRERKRITGCTVRGNFEISFTPTYVRTRGRMFIDRLRDANTLPLAVVEDKDTIHYDHNQESGQIIFRNLILESLGKKFSEQMHATRQHYSYPETDYAPSVQGTYAMAVDRYCTSKGRRGLSLLEFLNVEHAADCDVANTEFMLRKRLDGYLTRLGIGYLTWKDGRASEMHGWCNTLDYPSKRWFITDVTPTRKGWLTNKDTTYYVKRGSIEERGPSIPIKKYEPK
jgi:hypothetical protein